MSKKIRFIDSSYNDLFSIEDGEEIIITQNDGSQLKRACIYIDDYHVKIGNSILHICEFAEKMERCGSSCNPAPKTSSGN